MSLTDREKEQLKAMIDAGEPLPPKYRAVLFADPHEAELIWPGKTSEVTSVVLPFQSIEQIDEPRAEMNAHVGGLFDFDASTGRQAGGWSNKLIWGDNKLVLASLKNGPLRQEIEKAGGLKLVYIDPPFDIGADFSVDINIGEDSIANYYPDFLVKHTDSEICVIETKGREDLDDPPKWERLQQWCADATAHEGQRVFKALFVRQEDYEKFQPKNFAGLVAMSG